MADQMRSVFEELAPYAQMIVVPGVTVGKLAYSNQQDLYSEGVITVPATGVVRNVNLPLFYAALNEPAQSQGFAAGDTMTLGQTNCKFSKGIAPANQVFVATHLGFSIGMRSSNTLAGVSQGLPMGYDLMQFANNLYWDLTIARGITRTIGTLGEWPAGSGVWGESADTGGTANTATAGTPPTAVDVTKSAWRNKQLGGPDSLLRRLQVPIVFPPLVDVNINVRSGNPFLLTVAGAAYYSIRACMAGFLMTMPVG